ncbi:MAG: hypothetical protein J1F41_03835 [Lachnospiraceae bacterium]|nr:hypothetical protein [Lachnospiraceae bacterium]
MVNRVDGNNYYEYSKLKNVNVSNNGEKFSLDYKQDELQPEEKEKKDKTLSEQEKKQAALQSGVKLELSGQGQAASADMGRLKKGNAADTTAEPSLLELVQSFFTTLVSTIKDFFYQLWYDTEPTTDDAMSVESEAAEVDAENAFVKAEELPVKAEEVRGTEDVAVTTDAVTDMDALTAHRMNEERLQREIQPYLRKGDLNQVISLLTDDGKKTIARNSTLLTYYDRNGRMVEPSASDRERILHGDRNTREL